MEGVGSPDGRVQPRLLASEILPISGLRTGTRGEDSRPTHPSLSPEAGAGNPVNGHQLSFRRPTNFPGPWATCGCLVRDSS